MKKAKFDQSVSRRSTIAMLTGGGLGLAIAANGSAALAQTGAVDHSAHPLCGMWLVLANPQLPEEPQVYATSLFAADGSVVLLFPLSQRGADGVVFVSPCLGVWEPYDDHIGHFTATQSLSDIEGNLLNSVTIDGHPHVSDDGMAFTDDGSLVTVTIRDATGEVVAVVPPGTPSRPITAVRMAVGESGFPGNAPGEGTPVD